MAVGAERFGANRSTLGGQALHQVDRRSGQGHGKALDTGSARSGWFSLDILGTGLLLTVGQAHMIMMLTMMIPFFFFALHRALSGVDIGNLGT